MKGRIERKEGKMKHNGVDAANKKRRKIKNNIQYFNAHLIHLQSNAAHSERNYKYVIVNDEIIMVNKRKHPDSNGIYNHIKKLPKQKKITLLINTAQLVRHEVHKISSEI